ncbi:MAG TPA: hypothetical protein VG106_03710, partial [Vicinamibacterales bacterium]|nr:hypothetical protein [Vicinamibacterales bacterium]
ALARGRWSVCPSYVDLRLEAREVGAPRYELTFQGSAMRPAGAKHDEALDKVGLARGVGAYDDLRPRRELCVERPV